MAALHPFSLPSSLDGELSLSDVFGFSAHDLAENRCLRLSWRQRFYPTLKLLPCLALTTLSLWLINTALASVESMLIEAEFLQAFTPAATLTLLLNRFWEPLTKATVRPWSEVRMVEGTLHKNIEVEQDSEVRIVRYFCVIGGEILPLTASQFNVLQPGASYRAYIAYPLRHIVSIEALD